VITVRRTVTSSFTNTVRLGGDVLTLTVRVLPVATLRTMEISLMNFGGPAPSFCPVSDCVAVEVAVGLVDVDAGCVGTVPEVGTEVGGIEVLVGGAEVLVGGAEVFVGDGGVFVEVLVGALVGWFVGDGGVFVEVLVGVLVAVCTMGMAVFVGGAGVSVGVLVGVFVAVGGTGVLVGVAEGGVPLVLSDQTPRPCVAAYSVPSERSVSPSTATSGRPLPRAVHVAPPSDETMTPTSVPT
jgi:hypothetical protein